MDSLNAKQGKNTPFETNNSYPAESTRFLLVFLLILFGVVLLRRAWLCDDAYISFRVVDNFINGYRLTWNIMERVQVYTHPLWMFTVSLFYWITGEIYLTTLLLSVAISLLAVTLLASKIAIERLAALLAVFALTLSKAFIDYSTSGLENPLSHLLLVIFFILFFRAQTFTPMSIFWLSLVASLGVVNRMDVALIFVLPLAYLLIKNHSRNAIAALFIGQAPLILWEIFAIVYYGFPFPNTAYAKLNTGISNADYVQQGLLYFLNSLQWDAITVVLIAFGLALGFSNHSIKERLAAVGVVFYLLYIVRVGGDFMSGRFFTVPLFVSVILIIRRDFSRLPGGVLPVLFGAALMLALSVPNPTLRISDYGEIDRGPVHLGSNGILDERMLYYGSTGLLNTLRDVPQPSFYWAQYGEQARLMERPLADNYGIGMFGFAAGPHVYVIDKLALADPLLARLPAKQKVDWRIGHFERQMPDRYYQSLLLRGNVLEDDNLRMYYDKLNLVTKGRLFDPARWVEIWRFNTGQYDHLIDRDRYQYPTLVRLDLADVTQVIPRGTGCRHPSVTVMDDSGVEVQLGEPRRPTWLWVSLSHNDRYRLRYFLGETQVGEQPIATAYLPEPGGVSARLVRLPKGVSQGGFDRLRILPLQGDGEYCLAYLQFID